MADTEVVLLPDAVGNTLSVRKFNGRLWPDFAVESLAGVQALKAHDDDVIVVAYPKSGTHWVWEMVRLLQAGTTVLPLVEKDDSMIEDVAPEIIEAQPSPRALNTHAHFELMPPEVLANPQKCKLVYVTRDPRDVAVSYFNHHKKLVQYYKYNGQWKDYFPMFLEGKVDYESWFAYTKGWEEGIKNHPELQVHVTSYEALHENTTEEMLKLSSFLGTSKDPAFLEQVVKKTSFDNMRNTKGKADTYGSEDGPVMYRKGKVGDWKNWFTVAQSEVFNAAFEREMTGTQAYELYSCRKGNANSPDGNMNER